MHIIIFIFVSIVRVIRCNSGSVSIESTNTVINNINCDRSSGNITECSFSTSTRCNGYTSFYNSVELECFESENEVSVYH